MCSVQNVFFDRYLEGALCPYVTVYLRRHATPRHAIPRHTTPRHATPRHAMPCHAIPYHTIPYQYSLRENVGIPIENATVVR